jgi:nicotinamidase-related amidase
MIYELDPAATALLIIDAQMEYVDKIRPLAIPNAETIISRIADAARAARSAGARVIHVKHEHRTTGSDQGRMSDFGNSEVFAEGSPFSAIHPSVTPVGEEPVIVKRRYSAFEGTELDQLLRGNSIDTVVISGFMTQFCCVSSARSAHDRDYRTVFLSDATGGPDLSDVGFGAWTHEQVQSVVLTALGHGVAEIIRTHEFTSRVCRRQASAIGKL